MERILDEIRQERNRQNEKWGGSEHDDKNTFLDWYETISDYNAWARRMAAMGSVKKARRRWVQVAALAVAVIEAIDRSFEAVEP